MSIQSPMTGKSPMAFTVRYVGASTAATGTMSVARITKNSTLRPGKRRRAKA